MKNNFPHTYMHTNAFCELVCFIKKIIKLTFVLFFCNISFAQIFYSNYLDQTCQWKYYGVASTAFYHEVTFKTVYFDGTENFNGYTYYREKFLTLQEYYDLNDPTIFLGSNFYNPIEYNLIREDATGKIYRILYNQTNEVVALDNQTIINAQIGDPIPNTPYFNFGGCPVFIINYINIASLNLKQLVGYDGPNTGIIEGIGVIRQGCGGDVGGLSCFERQGQTVQFQNIDCTLFPSPPSLSVNTLDLSKPIIFPNPTNAELSITLKNENIKRLELFDVQGRSLKVIKMDDFSTKIDFSNYQKGTYFVLIETESRVLTEKIIKN